jgi:hypothetical protein
MSNRAFNDEYDAIVDDIRSQKHNESRVSVDRFWDLVRSEAGADKNHDREALIIGVADALQGVRDETLSLEDPDA